MDKDQREHKNDGEGRGEGARSAHRVSGKPKSDRYYASLEAADKQYKDRDGNGLYLLVLPSGGKYWRYDYEYGGKKKTLALGVYGGVAGVSLKDAREAREAAKKSLLSGIDPKQARDEIKNQNVSNARHSFEEVAREFWKRRRVAQQTLDEEWRKLELNILPQIGSRPVRTLSSAPPVMLAAIRTIEQRGVLEVARRCATLCGQIFRFAIAEGLCEHNPMPDIKDAFMERCGGHHAAIDADGLPEFLRRLHSPSTSIEPRTRMALLMTMYTFVRQGDLRHAKWADIDFRRARWVIPAQHRKLHAHQKLDDRNVFVVPLSRQVLALLEELKPFSAADGYLFRGRSSKQAQMSDGAVLMAVKRMGYTGKMTAHGFRALATSICHARLGWPIEIIDCQLAHIIGDATKAAYFRDLHMKARIEMMQEAADYIDAVGAGVDSDAAVTAIIGAARFMRRGNI
jgi:integrase